MQQNTIASRLFVVGCPRSGTTLLQSFLAAHPAVQSFPETAVFARLLATGSKDRPAVDPASIQAARVRALGLLDTVGRRDLDGLIPEHMLSAAEFARAFVAVLDRVTLDAGKNAWLEKTPRHLALVSEIRRLVPDARFVYILRDGPQNVASLYEAARRHPNVWWQEGADDLEEAVKRWNRSMRYASALRDDPDVHVVRYERLISETEPELRTICAFAGLPFEPEMIDRRAEAARGIVTAAEPWKAGVLEDVWEVDDKFARVFDAEQRAYVTAHLEAVDL